ncbi:MAG: septum formation initiator family protein [Oscillospiraceae bacterium]|nr:septum formation initiator family protein [Oscillospiraceae bacterium]
MFSIITTNMQINEDKQKYEELLQQTEAVEEENASIERYLVDGADMDEYIEAMARDKLNYANPDERVYYIVPSGD